MSGKIFAGAVALFLVLGAGSASAVSYTPDAGNGVYSFDISFTANQSVSSGFLGFLVEDYFSVPGFNSNSASGSAQIFVNGVSVANNCPCDLGTNGNGPGVIQDEDFLFTAFTSATVNSGDVVRFLASNFVPNAPQGTISQNPGDSFLLSNSFGLASGPGGPVSAVPLPAALPLMAGGLGLLGVVGWRRRRKDVAT